MITVEISKSAAKQVAKEQLFSFQLHRYLETLFNGQAPKKIASDIFLVSETMHK